MYPAPGVHSAHFLRIENVKFCAQKARIVHALSRLTSVSAV